MGRLKDRIAADLKEAMRSRDQLRLDTLRSAISGFTYKRSEAGQDLTDTDELDVVRRLVKQRSDSVSEFEKAGRTELAAKERAEREILLAYLPQQKTPAEIREIVQSVLAELPQENRNAGAVMKIVMPALRGLADGNLVRQIVTEALATQ
ncbi:MAG: GatB/YqeY domain-containing protein [Candidatus Eremiobacteraeota bacterium]|nr:GatB/YqeY domain-containing protein [Candidatus Eremiobacteraeota bacterium]